MFRSRKPILATPGAGLRFGIAMLFVVAAGISAVAHADTRSVEGFDIDTVVLRGSDELKIEWSDQHRLLVKGNQSNLDMEPFYVRGKTLYLGYTQNRKSVRGVKYLLEIDSLEKIVLKGSGTIWVDPIQARKLKVDLEGSGDIRLHEVTAEELEVSVSGSGNVQLAKVSSSSLSLELAGSGEIDLGRVETGELEIDMAGSGDIVSDGMGEAETLEIGLAGSGDIDIQTIRAKRADIGIAGSGDVAYNGEPELDTNVMGSGDIRPIH